MALLRGAARPPPDEAVEEVAILEGKALAEDEVRKASPFHLLQILIAIASSRTTLSKGLVTIKRNITCHPFRM